MAAARVAPVQSHSQWLAALRRFMAIPSVSAQATHRQDVRRCAAWLAGYLRSIGLAGAALVETGGHPAVVAEWKRRPGRPTVLVYGHYDVQPAEPLKAWTSPPFVPTVRGENLYGRGASDDKGQLFAHLRAIECGLATGGLPVNVVCLFDGEEEIGSPNLRRLLQRLVPRLRADVAVISDTRMLGYDRPAITYALRGALTAEVRVKGPVRELHSGTFGGAVADPAAALCRMVASLHDRKGRVAVRGFYDDVEGLTPSVRARVRAAGPSNATLLAGVGVPPSGETGYTAYERTVIRPCLTVTGMKGGYAGPGRKSVVPTSATARLNLRLVPRQDPVRVGALLRRHLEAATPQGVTVDVRVEPAARPVVVDRRHPGMRAAAIACERAFGRPPVFLRSGGSIPAVSLLLDVLGMTSVLMGFGLPDANIHSVDERLHLPTLDRAVVACSEFLAQMSRVVGRDG